MTAKQIQKKKKTGKGGKSSWTSFSSDFDFFESEGEIFEETWVLHEVGLINTGVSSPLWETAH